MATAAQSQPANALLHLKKATNQHTEPWTYSAMNCRWRSA